MKTGQQEYDRICNENWVLLLKIYNNIKGTPEQRREQYVGLKELAKSKTLGARQSEGIEGRCVYQIHLIDNPTAIPFPNSERQETRNLQLSKEQSNGTSK